MTIIAPNAIPQVALASMNATHAEEVELVGSIAELLQSDAPGEDLKPLLEEWLEHTRQHFEREHALMERSGFPAYAIHRNEHLRVLGLLEGVIHDYLQGASPAALARFVLEDWPLWFDQHVRTMDTATAQFARMRGIEA